MLLARMAGARTGRPSPLRQMVFPLGHGTLAQNLRQPRIEQLRWTPGVRIAERREIVKAQSAADDENILVSQTGHRPPPLALPATIQPALHPELPDREVCAR